MRQLLIGAVLALPLVFSALPANAMPVAPQTSSIIDAVTSDIIEVKGGHGHGWGHGWGRGHGHRAYGWGRGRKVGWGAQTRDSHAVTWMVGLRQFWPHMLVGWGVIATLAMTNPAALPVALLTAGGLALSVPLAVVTASPVFARFVLRFGIGRLPEETQQPEILRALDLPALKGNHV